MKKVYRRATNHEDFDREVNELLNKGYKLGRVELRTVENENKYNMLFALLFKQQ